MQWLTVSKIVEKNKAKLIALLGCFICFFLCVIFSFFDEQRIAIHFSIKVIEFFFLDKTT